MVKIIKMSDRIKLSVKDVTFWIAPLSKEQKAEASNCTTITHGGTTTIDLFSAQAVYIKYGLKKVEGLEDHHGNKYKLSFENECLTEDCISEILYLPESEALNNYFWQSLNGLPTTIKDPHTGKKMTGVILDVVSKEKFVT